MKRKQLKNNINKFLFKNIQIINIKVDKGYKYKFYSNLLIFALVLNKSDII